MKNKPKYKKGIAPSQLRKINKIKIDPLKRFVLNYDDVKIVYPDGTVKLPKKP